MDQFTDILPSSKHCGMCQRDLPADAFARNRAKPDGLNSRCRTCCQAFRQHNAARLSQQRRAAYRENHAQRQEQMRRSYHTVTGPRLKEQRRQQAPAREAEQRRQWEHQVAELRCLYAEKERPLKEIAAHFGVCVAAICNWLKWAGIPKRGHSLPKVDVDKAELERLYVTEGLDGHEVARRLGVSSDVLYDRLHRFGIPIRRSKDLPSEEELRQLYIVEGLNMRDIGKSLGIAKERIGERIRQLGIPVRKYPYSGKVCEAEDGHMVRSSFELRVDNWLSRHGLTHEYEPSMPWGGSADFLVGDTYIEIWGLTDKEWYRARMSDKRRMYEKHNFRLVEVDNKDFATGKWEAILRAAFLE